MFLTKIFLLLRPLLKKHRRCLVLRIRPLRSSLLVILCAICLVGCAHYSTTTGMIGGIRSVGVPTAENETAEFDIGERLSERTGDAFISDGRLLVVDDERSDAALLMRVISLIDRPFTYTAKEQTEQYRFSVEVRAELVRNADDEILLELPRLEGWGTYDARLADDEEGGREFAVDAAFTMIIEEIVDRITASW